MKGPQKLWKMEIEDKSYFHTKTLNFIYLINKCTHTRSTLSSASSLHTGPLWLEPGQTEVRN